MYLTLALRAERQRLRARVSEIKIGRLGLCGVEHSKCDRMMTLGFKGLVHYVGKMTEMLDDCISVSIVLVLYCYNALVCIRLQHSPTQFTYTYGYKSTTHFDPLKRSGVRWLHFEMFSATQV